MKIVKGKVYSICGDNEQYAKCEEIVTDEQGRDVVLFQRIYYDNRKSYSSRREIMYV